MESRNEWQCSAKHEGTMRAHPDNWKMKVKKIFPHLARRDRCYTPLCIVFGSGRTTPKYLTLVLGIVKCEIRSCPVFWNLRASKLSIFAAVQVIQIKCRMFLRGGVIARIMQKWSLWTTQFDSASFFRKWHFSHTALSWLVVAVWKS